MCKYFVGLASLTMALLVTNCVSVTRQSKARTILDVSQEGEIEGTGMSSTDIRSMSERMALDIRGIMWPENLTTVRIALTDIENQTRFPLNPNVVKDRLLADLIELSQEARSNSPKSRWGELYFVGTYYCAFQRIC